MENRKEVAQIVGSAQAAEADTEFFQQARQELGSGAAIAQVVHRAQELKAIEAAQQTSSSTEHWRITWRKRNSP